MQLKTRPLILALIVIFGLTAAAFLLTSSLRYTSPGAVLGYQRSRPHDVAIACFNPQQPAQGYYQNADQVFPLGATFKLVLLSAYAEQVAAGQLNPQESLPLAELEKYYLPGTDGGAHPAFLQSLPAGSSTLSLSEVASAMSAYGSNAAADYLAWRLSNVDFASLYQRLGLQHTSLPGSFLGLYLFIKNHETGLYAEEELSLQEVRAEQERLANLFSSDPAWRQAEISFISKPTNAPALTIQKQVLEAYGARGSASDMSRIMLAAYGYIDGFSPQAQSVLREQLEWPARLNPQHTAAFIRLASASGAWPGVLTSAWYAQAHDLSPRVLVVLYRNMPADFWDTWITTFSHQQLETQVLSSPDCSLFSQQ